MRVVAEIEDEIDDFPRFGGAANGGLHVGHGGSRENGAGHDAAGADVVFCAEGGDGFRHAVHGGFGGGVVDAACGAFFAGDGAEVDDDAVVVVEHVADAGADEVEGAFEIDVDAP